MGELFQAIKQQKDKRKKKSRYNVYWQVVLLTWMDWNKKDFVHSEPPINKKEKLAPTVECVFFLLFFCFLFF